MNDWIDPLIQGDDEHEALPPTSFEWKGSDDDGWTLYFEGAPKGYFRYLTQVNHIKQEVFPDDLNWVWFDEFIPLVWKKLPGVVSEGDALRAIVKTIEHDTVHTREEKGLKPVRVLLFANPFTWNNPVLSYFKILPKYGINRVGPDIVCELLPPYEEEKKSTKMTVDEFLGDEVNRNQGFINQDAYVGTVPKNATPYESIRLGQAYFTLYKKDRRLYVKRKTEHTDIQKINQFTGKSRMNWYGSLDGLQETEVCIEGTKHLEILKSM